MKIEMCPVNDHTRLKLVLLLHRFIVANNSFDCSLNAQRNVYDDPRQLIVVLECLHDHEEIVFCVSCVLKIICRKEINRLFIGEVVTLAVLNVLRTAVSIRIAQEASECLNLYFE